MKLAIVGTGISGMTCAHYLKNHKVSIFEKNDYAGGHTHTHSVGDLRIDTGFIVFNMRTYPNLLKLFDGLGIEKQKSNMSFSVTELESGLEYSSSSIFAQRKNLFSLLHWKFIREIKFFFSQAVKDYHKPAADKTIKEYCKEHGLSDYFLDKYLVPMTSAIWSTPHHEIHKFPLSLLLPFFFNHGLLGNEFPWYTVVGGSDTYTKKILEQGHKLHLKEPVLSVEEKGKSVRLETSKQAYYFDAVIMACHADDSLRIAKVDKKKQKMLEAYTYISNTAVLHTDDSVMPKKAWASWNQIVRGDSTSTVYWMNRLQKLNTNTNYFVSINPIRDIDKSKTIKKLQYDHPLFTIENFALQTKLQELNKNTKIFFCGSYFGYGFHEDGCKSAMKVVEKLK